MQNLTSFATDNVYCYRRGHTIRFNISQLPMEIACQVRTRRWVDLPQEGVQLRYGSRGGYSNQAVLLPGFRWSGPERAVYAIRRDALQR